MELTIPAFEKIFPAAEGRPAFTLAVPEMTLGSGTLTYVMGHNGSGKSVFLKTLAGELWPSRGRSQIRCTHESGATNLRGVGLVQQRAEQNLALDLTVRENLVLRIMPAGLLAKLFPVTRIGTRVREALHRHEALLEKADQPCCELSVGQRQTLAFLAVASQRHPLLLLDEYLAATDHSTSESLRALARSYARETPASVLIVSHDVDLALGEADRILVLRDGAFVLDIGRESEDWLRPNILRHLVSSVES